MEGVPAVVALEAMGWAGPFLRGARVLVHVLRRGGGGADVHQPALLATGGRAHVTALVPSGMQMYCSCAAHAPATHLWDQRRAHRMCDPRGPCRSTAGPRAQQGERGGAYAAASAANGAR